MMTDHTRAIEARDLVKTYPGDVRALDGISLTVQAGTIFGLLGPNGAGKSTTVKVLTTLSRPDSGSALVAGHDVLRQPDRVRRSIGVVGQKAAVDPSATGRENLRLQGQIYGLGGRRLEQRIGELLDQFGLTDAADRIVQTWSGGMQRKLDVAMGPSIDRRCCSSTSRRQASIRMRVRRCGRRSRASPTRIASPSC